MSDVVLVNTAIQGTAEGAEGVDILTISEIHPTTNRAAKIHFKIK
jgi:hypothetical protein